MPYSNLENEAWNALHNGSRVPINNTGVEGAPAALASDDPNWKEGSLNKAVYDTYILTDVFSAEDSLDAEAGTIDLLRLRKFVNKDMLYGFNADARNRLPGDAMSFRGYPTPVIFSETNVVESAQQDYPQSMSGVVGTTVGQYIVLRHSISLLWKLPYAVIYSVQVTEGPTTLFDIQVKISAGNLKPTEWLNPNIVVVDPALPEWNLLHGDIYFSVDSSSMIGDKTFTINAFSLLQEPYYGNLGSADLGVLEVDYTSTTPHLAIPIGEGYYIKNLFNANCYVSVCNEMRESVLLDNNQGLATTLFIAQGSTLQLGTTVYVNSALLATVPAGSYVFTDHRYRLDINGVSTYIYSISQIIFTNNQGIIIGIYSDIGECLGVSGCFPQMGCG